MRIYSLCGGVFLFENGQPKGENVMTVDDKCWAKMDTKHDERRILFAEMRTSFEAVFGEPTSIVWNEIGGCLLLNFQASMK